MIKTINIKICDICKREVEQVPGTLVLEYSDSDYTGCGYPVIVDYKDICIDCCRKLNKAITKVLEEVRTDE